MAHAPSRSLSLRHDAIRRALKSADLDALVVTSLPNVLYLTNFSGSAAIVVLTADRLHFLTDFRYFTAIGDTSGTQHECTGLELVPVEGSYDGRLAQLLGSLSAARVGFEAAHLTVSRHAWLRRTLDTTGSERTELVATEGIVERARLVKDSYEIETLRTAGRSISAVTRRVLHSIHPGQTERELALAIDFEIRRAGFERSAFDTIVASGPNAALPHAHPGERKLIEGDLVVLDFGGVHDSYCVDLTRTVSIGKAGERAAQVYAAVLEAHDCAVASVAPGRSRFDIDAAARDSLGRHGLAEAFGHGTGHGLGLEVHEDPRVTRPHSDVETGSDVEARDEELREGMVFTIEPGAYLAGWGGVRIEDDVLVTSTGVELLTDVPTGLVEI